MPGPHSPWENRPEWHLVIRAGCKRDIHIDTDVYIIYIYIYIIIYIYIYIYIDIMIMYTHIYKAGPQKGGFKSRRKRGLEEVKTRGESTAKLGKGKSEEKNNLWNPPP